ncbi:cell adhesion molecule 2-like, partial [Argopecten irradians]|uniref:cell adhesion molecule 2-like n=1 Tax=Argopecten irradians TaxID=31199 RepID=UPI0037112624
MQTRNGTPCKNDIQAHINTFNPKNLLLKPRQPTLSIPSSQTENTTITVVCVSTGSRPAADIEWNVGGTWLSSNPEEVKVLDNSTDTYTVTSSLSRRVTRQDNGKSVYCRVSNRALSGGIESVRQTITVLFGPDSVSITGNRVVVADGTNTLTLTCTTQEYNRHVHITWYNGTTRIPNTAAVTNTSGSYGGFISTQVLQLVPDRYQDGNVVRCVVQNEDVTLGERTASVTLDINCQYGLHTTTGLDIGPQFKSKEVFMKQNGIRHITSEPYYPRANGLAERFLQTFKIAMKHVKGDNREQPTKEPLTVP